MAKIDQERMQQAFQRVAERRTNADRVQQAFQNVRQPKPSLGRRVENAIGDLPVVGPVMGRGINAYRAIAREAGAGIPDAIAGLSELGDMIPGSQYTPHRFIAPAIQRGARALSGRIRERGASNPRYEGEFFADKVPSALGSMVPGIAATLAGGPAGGLAYFAGQGSERMGREAEEMGATERQEAIARLGGAALAPLEMLPIGRLAGRLRGPATAAGRSVATQLMRGTAGQAAEEGLQEGVSALGQNVIARDVAGYDPQRGYMQGVPESAAIGAVAGGILGGGATAIGQGRVSPGAQPDNAITPEIVEDGPAGQAGGLPVRSRLRTIYDDGTAPAPQQQALPGQRPLALPEPQRALPTSEARSLALPEPPRAAIERRIRQEIADRSTDDLMDEVDRRIRGLERAAIERRIRQETAGRSTDDLMDEVDRRIRGLERAQAPTQILPDTSREEIRPVAQTPPAQPTVETAQGGPQVAEVTQDGEVQGQRRQEEVAGLSFRKDGAPFSSRGAARQAARRAGHPQAEVVQTEGGWGWRAAAENMVPVDARETPSGEPQAPLSVAGEQQAPAPEAPIPRINASPGEIVRRMNELYDRAVAQKNLDIRDMIEEARKTVRRDVRNYENRAKLQQTMDRWEARLTEQAAEQQAAEAKKKQGKRQTNIGTPGRGQRGAIDTAALEAVVDGAIRAAKWTADATNSAARWLSSVLDAAQATIGRARRVLVDRFGNAIRKHVGEIWRAFKAIMPERGMTFGQPGRGQRGAVGVPGGMQAAAQKAAAEAAESVRSYLNSPSVRHVTAKTKRLMNNAMVKTPQALMRLWTRPSLVLQSSPTGRKFFSEIQSIITRSNSNIGADMAKLEKAQQKLTILQRREMRKSFFERYESGGVEAFPEGPMRDMAQLWKELHNKYGQMAEDLKVMIADPRMKPTVKMDALASILGVSEADITGDSGKLSATKVAEILGVEPKDLAGKGGVSVAKLLSEINKAKEGGPAIRRSDIVTEGRRPFKNGAIPNFVMHQLTPTAQDAIQEGSGEIFDAIAEATGMSQAELRGLVEETDFQHNMRRNGHLENARVIMNLPFSVTTKSGEVVNLRERDPFIAIPKYIQGAALRLEIIREWGQDTAQARVDEYSLELKREGNVEAGRAVDGLWSILNGSKSQKEREFMRRYRLAWVPGLESLARMAQLSTSALSQVSGWVPQAARAGMLPTIQEYSKMGISLLGHRIGLGLKTRAEMEFTRNAGGWAYDTTGHTYETEDFSGLMETVAKKVLEAVQFNRANRILNRAGSLIALHSFMDGVMFLRNPKDSKLRKWWGMDPDSVRRMLKRNFDFTDADIDRMVNNGMDYRDFETIQKKAETDPEFQRAYQDMAQAVQRFVGKTNLFHEPITERPVWMHARWARMFMAYASYMRAMGNAMSDAIREATYGNVRLLATLLIGGTVGGAMVDKLKDLIFRREDRGKPDNKALAAALMILNWQLEAGTYGLLGMFGEDLYWMHKLNQPNMFDVPLIEWWASNAIGITRAMGKEDPGTEIYKTIAKNTPIIRAVDAQMEGPLYESRNPPKKPRSSGGIRGIGGVGGGISGIGGL